ncbi:ANR family transcriptional regulator [Photobacterium damselae subsp. damselae]|uniref:ANR family transcriptional regulator n=1 Tax=Photobacterium damselae TaxID=38293 RepID=UPI00311AD766
MRRENSDYLFVANKAADAEKGGKLKEAAALWHKAWIVASKNQNAIWAQCRADFCKSHAR